jgi:hypothetical protein
MNQVVPYNNQQHSESEGLSVKEKIVYTLLVGAALGAAIHFGSRYVKKVRANKSDSKSFQDGNAQTTAKLIKMAFENDGQFGTDTKALRRILTSVKSKQQLSEIATEYQKQFGRGMYNDMYKELQSSEYKEMLQIAEGKPEKTGGVVSGTVLYKSWAVRLKSAFDKMYSFFPGTDEVAIRTVLQEIPTQRAFINVGVAYYKEYKTQLLDDLKSELSSSDYTDSLMLITNKPKA